MMHNNNKQIINPDPKIRFDRQFSCIDYISQMEAIKYDHIELNLIDNKIDYPTTSLLIWDIIEKLNRIQTKEDKNLTILTYLFMPEVHILNLLFRDPDSSTHLSKEELKKRIEQTDINVVVKMTNYDYRNNQVLEEKEICLP